MQGAIVQLAAKGRENEYIDHKPEITLFKTVYRRHTNFIKEQINQYFKTTPDFGKRVTCTLSSEGDLLSNLYLSVELPSLNIDSAEVSWVDYIGFTIIKSFDFIIDGKVIDSIDGEYIRSTLMYKNSDHIGLKKMVGHIPELYEYSNYKDSHRLLIPLNPFFSRSSSLYFPLAAAKQSKIEVAIEFNSFKDCHRTTPGSYIKCEKSMVAFKKGELLKQTIDRLDRYGRFHSYDIINQRLYYYPITEEKFIGIESSILNLSLSQKNEVINDPQNTKYKIIGLESGEETMPSINVKSKTHLMYDKLRGIRLKEAHLIGDFCTVDKEERNRFLTKTLDYTIEQVYTSPETRVDGTTAKIILNVLSPCKYLIWRSRMVYNRKSKDYYNYSSTPMNKDNDRIIKEETVLLDGVERVTMRDSRYFTEIQPLAHMKNIPSLHYNLLSFALKPMDPKPTGSCNFTEIDKAEIYARFSKEVNFNRPAAIKYYGIVTNILRVTKGIAALLFDEQV